jgi:hypothetical protein
MTRCDPILSGVILLDGNAGSKDVVLLYWTISGIVASFRGIANMSYVNIERETTGP